MVTITLLLVLAAFVAAVMQMMGKCPSGVAALLLCILELLRVVPR